jgi:hypothetical protein
MNTNLTHNNESQRDPLEIALQNAMFSQEHPSSEVLGDRALGLLAANEAEAVDVHLRSCAVCKATYLELREEADLLDSYLDEAIEGSATETGKPMKPGRARIFTLPVYRYAAAAVLVIGLFYSGISFYPDAFMPRRYSLGDISSLQLSSITRGLDNPQLQSAQFEIQNKNYDKAIALLEGYIKSEQQDVFYVNYLLGLTYLHASKQNVALVVPGYNEQYLRKAKEHLLTSIQLNTNPQLVNISLDAAFYAAKAAILLNQNDEARQLLNRVVAEKGSMMDEAKNLVERL